MLLLIATSPISTLAAVAVRVTMGKPVLFRQKRAGLHGVPFSMFKFRSMIASEVGDEDSEHDGQRITSIGRVLRASSVDELPSLLNVVRGEMSLVGPRPLPVRYTERYTEEEAVRLQVKPGVTGWAQIHGRNLLSWDEKLSLDAWYVHNRSFPLDLKILLLTVLRVVRSDGITQPGHATMPEFRVP